MAAKKKKYLEKKAAGTTGPKSSLRDDAENQLARSPGISPDLKGQTSEELIHELRVHQIELETQADELRRAHLALEESRDKYLDLYEFAPVGYLTLSYNALVADVNLAGATLLGVERKKLERARFRKFVAPLDLDMWDRYFMSVLNDENKLTTTLKLKRGDGSPFPARLECIRRISSSDGTTTVRMAISDITDSRRAEEALRETSGYLDNLLDYANAPIIVWDPSFHITRFNHAFERLTGRRQQEVIGQRPDILFPAESRDNSLIMIKKTLDGERWETVEIPILTKDGSVRTVIWNSANVLDPDARIISTIAQGVDITERKRAEETLRDANKKLYLLSGITRHDINNQLLALNGFLALLHREVQNPALADYFSRITNASARITAMIQFTKTYERLGAEAPIWQDTSALVETAVDETRLGSVRPVNDLPAGTEVFADPLIVKVFYNLMENAVEYGETITAIRFSGKEHGGNYLIVCEDDGVGIPDGEKDKIFERGFGKNTGLGLFLAREILSITGITIRETGEPGKGARFEMTVPKGIWRTAGEDRIGD